jgi:hypothetical protein
MHDRTISLRFLCIISRVLKFLYMDFLKNIGKGYGFLAGFPPFSFTMYSLNHRKCKRLREFEEEKNLKAKLQRKTFAWISSKNSASGLSGYFYMFTCWVYNTASQYRASNAHGYCAFANLEKKWNNSKYINEKMLQVWPFLLISLGLP